MTTETKERRINTDAKRRDHGAGTLPHERDELPDAHEHSPRGVMKQAADDLAQGLVDTDLHGMRGVEATLDTSGAPGQARPRADAEQGMRHHDSPTPSNNKK
jgi:hypothetical protein